MQLGDAKHVLVFLETVAVNGLLEILAAQLDVGRVLMLGVAIDADSNGLVTLFVRPGPENVGAHAWLFRVLVADVTVSDVNHLVLFQCLSNVSH